uniref:Uncharacterized protein n=1 Tax=Photinus pyralis TaxID=7054 RepID=A0A1Y1JZY3_PHOPY
MRSLNRTRTNHFHWANRKLPIVIKAETPINPLRNLIDGKQLYNWSLVVFIKTNPTRRCLTMRKRRNKSSNCGILNDVHKHGKLIASYDRHGKIAFALTLVKYLSLSKDTENVTSPRIVRR